MLAVLGFLYIVIAGSRSNGFAASASCVPGATVIADGFERAHRCVTTASPTAQAAFDDGLTLLYGFDPEGARRAFERSAREDPQLGIAWWGVANSYAPNINTSYDPADQRRGRDAIARAVAYRDTASPAERLLIDATTKRFGYVGAKDEARSAHAYRDAMFAAAKTLPDDDDVRVLAAEAEMDVHPWSYFTPDGHATPGTADLIAHLHAVLGRTPDHIGAEHFAIHAFEESGQPEAALDAARRLAARHLEPAAEHLTHMPAHTFMRVGAYHDAGEANARAVAAYLVYYAGNPAGHNDYFGHDCAFGVDAFLMAGESGRARALAAACKRDGSNFAATIDLRSRDWRALANDAGSSDFAGGMLLAHDKHLALAQAHVRALKTSSDPLSALQTALLEARIARESGKTDAELSALERAVKLQDGFGYAEPPTFFYPVRETLGGAYARARRFADAERVFRDDLARNRGNPRALFGLAETLARSGRTDEARAQHARFERAWRQADTELDLNEL
ncbi:MAG: tetratricopeptide repeat protein [Vulcanimicrobiaceae bacterium]